MSTEYFPYVPREKQRESIEFIQRTVEKNDVCLDAATGFGKTPIILASLLPHVEDSYVIWAVRTGNETDRPIEELKEIAKTHPVFGFSYRGKKDMCLLARDAGINSYEGVSILCKSSAKKCKYALAFNEKFNPDDFLDCPKLYSEIMSICRHAGICPYLAQRALLPYADVISLSYNYIVSEGLGWVIKRDIPFDSSYLVVDEAHNLQKISLNSDKITLGTLRYAAKELAQFRNVSALEERVNAMLRHAIKTQADMKSARENEREFSPVKFMRETGVNETILKRLRSYGSRIHKLQLTRGKSPHSSLYHLGNFWLESLAYNGVTGIAFIATRKRDNLEIERWDMRSAELLKDKWTEFKSCIFCSGTLRPMNGFAEIAGLTNWKGMHIPSSYNENQIITVITKGLSTKGQRLTNQMCRAYLDALDAYTKIDANLSIFNASYRIQNALINAGLKAIVERNGKSFFQERQGMSGDLSRKILDEFKDCAYSGRKGVLCATMTGRFAEGADFPGRELEGIFLVGIPFDQLTLRTKLYSDYYENLYGKKKGKYYSYIVPALRRSSQSLGRALRSKSDRAIFILGDERYADHRYFHLLPDFVQVGARVIDPSGLSELKLPEVLMTNEDIQRALRHKLPVRIRYKASNGVVTEREVDPYEIKDGCLLGYCHLRNERRSFKLNRIIKLDVIESREH